VALRPRSPFGAQMIRARLVCTWMPLLAAGLAVSNAAAGPAGFAFLEIPTGARASGMGGAYASVAQGAEAAFWNPAGLEGVNGVEVTGGHYEMFEKLRHDHFSVAGRMLGGGVSGRSEERRVGKECRGWW